MIPTVLGLGGLLLLATIAAGVLARKALEWIP